MKSSNSTPLLFQAESLRHFCNEAFTRSGLSENDAQLLSKALVTAELRGVDTHGVARTPAYARGFLQGNLNPTPVPRIVAEYGAVARIDGDNGIGHLLAQHAMHQAIARASKYGVGQIAVKNTNHTGMLAFHSMLALGVDMIGFVTSNGPATTAAWGGKRADLGNNPLSYAIPAGKELPIVLDLATSAAARGKIRIAAQRGESIPLGWALDAKGSPTTDAHAAMKGITLPFGGHKGYGLGIVVEVLSAALSGALLSAQVSKAFLQEGARAMDSWQSGLFAMATRIDAFLPAAEFKATVDELIRTLKSNPPAQGFERVYVPGELEFMLQRSREHSGIPLSEPIFESLTSFASELGIAPPVPS
ncbi:MAG TPA: Ldh family oxidoreductase [Anaerolineae bacterium]|nr:Ldh family oxidoreductase [Anaerolineae bacterium]